MEKGRVRVRARAWYLCCFVTGVYLGIELMPVAQPSPTHEQRITIYVKPYIRNFLIARLADPARRLTDDGSRKLFDDLQSRLRGRVLVSVVNDFDPNGDKAQQRVVLVVQAKQWHTRDLDLTTHQHLTGVLTKTFLTEMYAWVDWYRARLKMSTRRALESFRAHYGITDSHHDFLTAERLYQKHCRATGQSKPRRRKRRPKAIRS